MHRTEDHVGRIVIVCYRPKPGKDRDLEAVVRSHVATLRAEGLATAREAVVMKAGDGSIVEVFEWASKEAIDAAHRNPAVMKLWERFGEVCDFAPVGALPETGQMFSEFTPVN
jgi:quinol monooxygenase YgiN